VSTSNQLKTPPINVGTKLLSFDLETNGLHGQAFAVGALIIDGHGQVHDEFSARRELKDNIDEWVSINVLPVISDMPITHTDYESMRESFWTWYLSAKKKADYVLVNNGYPVEYRFLLDCQEADIEERYWQHPFPILDLSSLLIQVERRPSKIKTKLFSQLKADEKYFSHHPVHDAKKAAIAAFKAFEKADLLN
jgi:hypothetical protein